MRKIKDRAKQQRIARRKHCRELRARHSHDNKLLKYHRLHKKLQRIYPTRQWTLRLISLY